MRDSVFALVLLVVLVSAFGCARQVQLRPGRDAYYQVTTQLVPAQATGSHSQSVSLTTTGSTGDCLASGASETTTSGQ